MSGSTGSRLLAMMVLLLAHAVAAGQPMTQLSGDEARRDLRILKRALVDLHPGLYRYATAGEVDAAFSAADAEVADGASRGQMYLLASRLAAAVRCGHTWASRYNQAPAVVQEVFGRADKLPLTLRLVEGRFLVTGSILPEVPVGSELLAVDGRSAAEIVTGLMPYLRADGRGPGSDGKRRSQLDTGPNGGAMDRLFPLRWPPAPEGWRLAVRPRAGDVVREVRAAAVSEAARSAALRASGQDRADPVWSFRIDGDTGWLVLPTFAFWRGGFDANGFIARVFQELAEKAVPFLVIDLRDNEGGDDAIGRAVLARLLKTPYTTPSYRVESAYERVPYILARYLDTWDFGFFDRTGQVVRGPGRNWLLPPRTAVTTVPVAPGYAGRVLALVGPQNSSAGYLLARDLQRSGVATLVGQPTGGNLRGLNGGQLAWINLPASGVGVDIPLIASFAPGDEPDSGVMPEHPVVPRWVDVAAGVDTEAQAARALVAGWRSGLPR